MMSIAAVDTTVSDLLGLPAGPGSRSSLRLVAALADGLPVSALERVAGHLAPGDRAFRFRVVPRATLARRAKTAPAARLSPEEAAKVARLAKVWALAVAVWSDEREARDFLGRPHAALDGQRPLDVVLGSEFGGPIVEDLLQRLEFGVAV